MVTAWVGSSIFLGGFEVQWHTLSRWFANVEIKVRLFVAFGVLLSPQFQQKLRNGATVWLTGLLSSLHERNPVYAASHAATCLE